MAKEKTRLKDAFTLNKKVESKIGGKGIGKGIGPSSPPLGILGKRETSKM